MLGGYASEVVVANHNDPRQVVISGAIPAIEEAERRFVAAGVKVQRLPVAAAFHSPIVAGSVAPFAQGPRGRRVPDVLRCRCSPARRPSPTPRRPQAVRDLLASSIAKRVRFVDVVEAMYARGVRTFVEVGPSSVLTSMIARICGDRPHRAVPLDRPGRHGVTSLWQSAGAARRRGTRRRFLGPLARVRPRARSRAPSRSPR